MIINSLSLFYISIAWGLAFVIIKFAEQTIGHLTVEACRAKIGFLSLLILTVALSRNITGHASQWFAFLVFAVLGITYLWVVTALGEECISGLLTKEGFAVDWYSHAQKKPRSTLCSRSGAFC